MGNAKTIYPSLSGKNSACVSDIRSYCWLLKDTVDDEKVQIHVHVETWNSHLLTFFVFKPLSWSFIDTSWAAHLWVGNAKTIYPSLNGKNSACVSDIRSYCWFNVKMHHRWWQGANFDTVFTSLNFFVQALSWSFIDTSWAVHLWVGNAKTIYPSLNGKNSACVSDIRSHGWLLKAP